MTEGATLAAELDYVPLPANAIALVGRVWSEQLRDDRGAPVWPGGGEARTRS